MNILSKQLKRGLFWVFWIILFGLIWKNMLVWENGNLYAGWVNVWGDWAAHLSYVNSFGYSNNFMFKMPLLLGAKFSYPFMADLLSGCLIKAGWSMRQSVLIPSLILSLVLVKLLVKFGRELSGSERVGRLTAWLFLFNGGVGFFWWLKTKTLAQEFTHIEKEGIEWINIINSQVIPQRGFLLGFPLAILVYLWLYRYSAKKDVKALKKAGLVTAGLPLIHAHSFMVILGIAAMMGIRQLLRNLKGWKKLLKDWLWFITPVATIGFVQVKYFFGSALNHEGFIKWYWGWMAKKYNMNVGWFWLKNMGVSLLLAISGWKFLKKPVRQFGGNFWIIWLVANMWLFQPWEWDNTKLFTHWYLMVSLSGAVMIDKLWKHKNRWIKVGGGMLLGLAIWAGALDVLRLTQYDSRKILMIDKQRAVVAEWVKQNSKPTSVWLTTDNHDHWLPVLTGRQIMLGFNGWLWTYGLDFDKQAQAVKKIYEGGGEAIKEINKWSIDYIVVGIDEKQRVNKLNEQFFEDNFIKVYDQSMTKIYKVS